MRKDNRKKCKHIETEFQYFGNPETGEVIGKHLTCLKCGHHLQYTPDDSFIMPFGKFRGETLANISIHSKAYVNWFIRSVSGHNNIRERFKRLLSNNLSSRS